MLRMPPTTFWEMEERAVMSALIKRMDEERDALSKNLHTLRIEQSASIRSSWWCDRRRCILSPGKYPALRRVEIKTFQRLPLFALPYPQLTHLKLVTQERESILLGIVKGCKALECLAIALPQQKDTTPGPISVVHTGLTELHITIGSTNTGRFFIDGIQTPSLSILEITSNADCSGLVKRLMQRSKCSLTQFHFNLNITGQGRVRGINRHTTDNLLETLETVSNSLVDLTFKSRFKDLAWLEGLKPGRQMKSMTLDAGLLNPSLLSSEPGIKARTAAQIYRYFMQALNWTTNWMEGASELERENRDFAFMAGHIGGNPYTWGPDYFPEEVEDDDNEERCSLVERIEVLRGKVVISYEEPTGLRIRC
ncbi:hypothetical protein DFP72DRAFT_1058245 [Ephemerocybe angulata]|uniref:Uncharacterized protein n=1 Tax=Ephemerocybe angulata TaxID=980116 RepID=A0A8H6IJV2_9AGAR|nr:hypothetical protein DFP72DRAFT_1058245 [Tulosesus angulatus]